MSANKNRLVCRYTLQGDIEISGTKEGLIFLADSASLINEELKIEFSDTSNEIASPYDGFLTGVHFQQTTGAVILRIDNPNLVISGSADNLGIFAENIRWLAAGQNLEGESNGVVQHLHMEYYPSHFFLDPDAAPLVVCLE